MGFRIIDVRDHRFHAVECDEPEAPALAPGTNLLGVEPGERRARELLREPAYGGGLARAGRRGEQQMPRAHRKTASPAWEIERALRKIGIVMHRTLKQLSLKEIQAK